MSSERIVPLSEYHRLPRETQSLDYYKRLLEVVCNNATLALFIMDEYQQCVYMNPAAEALTGYTFEEARGRILHDVVHHTRPDGRPYPLCECPIDQAFPKNNREQGEEVFVHKDGHFYPVAYTASPIPEGDQIIGTIIEVRDITQEKLAEQASQEAAKREAALRLEADTARRRAETVLSSISDGVFVLDRDWRYTYVNDRLCEMAQKSREELIGHSNWELFPAAVGTDVYGQFHRAMQEQVQLQFEYHYLPWDQWFEYRVYPARQGITVFAADISDRKQAEAALRRSEERLRVSQELSLDAFTILDSVRNETGKIVDFEWTYVNPKAAELLKHPVNELLGQRLLTVLPGNRLNSDLFERYVQVVETGEPHDIELAYTSDGITGWFRNMAVKLEDGVAIFFSDITERKQTEQALREVEERLRVALQNAPITVFNQDRDLRYTWIHNPVVYELHEMLGKRDCDYLPPEDAEPLMALKQQVLETGMGARGEIKLTREGSSYYDLTVEPLRDERDQIVGITCAAIDISKLKQAEIDVRESEERLLFALAAARMIAWEWNLTTGISRRFGHATAALGLETGQAADFYQMIHPEDRETVKALVDRAIHRGADYDLEFRVITPDGRTIWMADKAHLRYDAAGNPSHLTGVCVDITDRKLTELALRQSEEQANLAIAVGQLGTWHYNLQTNQVEIDARMREIWGEPEGTTCLPLSQVIARIHPDDRQRVATAIQSALDPQSSGTYELDYRITWDDGSERWVSANGQAQFEGEGSFRRPMHFFGTALDITNRKQIETALAAQEQRYRYIFEAVSVPIWEEDFSQVKASLEQLKASGIEDFRQYFAEHPEFVRQAVNQVYLRDVNQAALRMFKAQDKADLLASLDRIFTAETEPAFIEELLTIAAEESYFEAETVLKTLQGDRIHTWVTITFPANSNSYDRVLVSLLDISDRVRAEAEREQLLAHAQAAREAAEAANRIKDEFLAVVSHELRSPLNPILGWSKLLRSSHLDPEKTDRALEIIERNARMQAQLINDLLDVSRILQGKLSLDTQPVDLATTIQAAIETVRLAAATKSLQIHTEIDPAVGQVSGDAGRLQQVVWNLLSNAVKFTPEGGRVEVRLEQVQGVGAQGSRGAGEPSSHHPTASLPYAQITVADTGKGIPPDFLPYVFDHFRQESSATTRRFGGLGLGLAIVRYLVELHGGTVQANSAGEGQGATFTVRLPLLPHPSAAQVDPPPFEADLDLQGIKILVVDDDDNTREFLAFLLELHGATVAASATAKDAIAALPQFQPDLVLSDIGMPDVDGYMLMQQIRALPPDQGGTLPAIALTAYAGEIDSQQALAAGFQRHLTKPVEPQVLIRAIATLLAEHPHRSSAVSKE
jgi:PAS domain S-box-containing protein